MSDCKDIILKHEITCQKENSKRFNELETEVKLSNQNFKYMQKDLIEIKSLVKEWFKNIYKKIDATEEKYATKTELRQTNKTISYIIKMWITAWAWLIWILIKLIYDFITR